MFSATHNPRFAQMVIDDEGIQRMVDAHHHHGNQHRVPVLNEEEEDVQDYLARILEENDRDVPQVDNFFPARHRSPVRNPLPRGNAQRVPESSSEQNVPSSESSDPTSSSSDGYPYVPGYVPSSSSSVDSYRAPRQTYQHVPRAVGAERPVQQRAQHVPHQAGPPPQRYNQRSANVNPDLSFSLNDCSNNVASQNKRCPQPPHIAAQPIDIPTHRFRSRPAFQNVSFRTVTMFSCSNCSGLFHRADDLFAHRTNGCLRRPVMRN